MKTTALLTAALAALLACACGKIELPDADDAAQQQKPSKPDESGGATPGDEDDFPEEDYALPVSQALGMEAGSYAYVYGYIVGYAPGTSVSSLTFSLPQEGPNTNMFIADSPNEMSPQACMAVRLATDKGNPRAALNLYDHPDLFRQPILILGYLDKYFSKTGIREISDFTLMATEQMTAPARFRR